jgi:uncharacterized membrane protein
MSRYIAYAAFGLLALLLLLTWHYESGGSALGVCRAWGSFLTGTAPWNAAGSMQEMHLRHMGGYGFRGFGLAFWVLVIAFLYLLLSGGERKPSAIDELNARFARGEITREEYEKAKRLLEEK